MSEIEDLVRQTLVEHERLVVQTTGLAQAARDRSRRRTRNWIAAVGAVTGLATQEHRMTDNAGRRTRVLGRLRSADGTGVVRIEDRYDTDIDDLWSALTDPRRLARWYGEVEGDLRRGGQFNVYLEAAGLHGVGRVEVCEPPRRLQVVTRETDESWQQGGGVPPFDQTLEATLTADGGQTILVIETHGMPLDKIAFYGAGWQIHAESLATYLAGREPGDTEARWDELVPPYQELATTIG